MTFSVIDGKDACSVCSGTGWELVEGRGVRPCVCKDKERIRKNLEASRIPLRYAQADFDTFEATNPSLTRALQTSRKFVEQFPKVEEGLLYSGSCGVGKTHLAIAVMRSLLLKGLTGYFFDMRDLLKEIQGTWKAETQTSEIEVLRPVIDADILVLDELGASIPSEWVKETVTHIVNRRYNEKRLTIFTTNYLDRAPDGQTLTDRIGERFRSRLSEMTKTVLIESKDYREIIRERRKS